MAPYRSGAEATVRLSCSNPPGVVYLSYAPLRSSTPVGEAARRSTATAASAAPETVPAEEGRGGRLRKLLGDNAQSGVPRLHARDTCPQIEVACGDGVTALVLRHLEPLSEADLARLRAFAREQGRQHPIQWWLQPKGPDSAHRLDEDSEGDESTPPLAYSLPEFGITMPFRPTDFTQVC